MNDAEEITHQPIVINELVCLRCGGTWIPRKAKMPGYCPKCNSPYWNKPRRVKKSDKIDEPKESGIAEVRAPDKEVVKDENRIYPPYLCCFAGNRYDNDEDKV